MAFAVPCVKYCYLVIIVKKLLKFFKGYGKESILGPLFKLFEATLELIVPLIIASVIDRGIGGGDRWHIINMCILLALLGVVGLGFSVTAQFFAAKASVGFITKTKAALFAHIQALSYSDIDELGTSGLITRLTSDATRVQTGVNLTLRLLLRSPFVVFGAMIMAFTIDASAGADFAVVIPLLSIVVFGIMLISMPLHKKTQTMVDTLLRKTRENLSGVRVVRAFGKEEDEVRGYVSINGELTRGHRHVGAISALMNPLTYIIINFGILALIYVGALKVDSGNLTQGEVIALYNYMSQILIELIKMSNLIITITKALASASRISAVLDTKTSQTFGEREEQGNGEYSVELSGATLKYRRAAENSVEGVSFKAKRGDVVGIIGGTGSGKSSLVSLIPRFYDATEGEVKLFGHNATEYTKGALEKMIGVVPQGAVLFAGTIRENMQFGNKSASDKEINEALRAAQALGVAEDKGGLDARVEAGGKNFSGGQRQRLTIARALVKKPQILILDDSASALDFATDAALRRALREMDGETTLFVVSQRAASVMHADTIIVLDDGQVVGQGRHDELLDSCPVYREIFDSQFKKEDVR